MPVKTLKLTLSVLICLFILAIASASAQTRQANARAQKKVTEEDLSLRLALARRLASEKKYDQALKEYLFVFDNSRNVSGFGGVRLSYVPSEIAEIGASYRPAILALQSRRDQSEQTLLAGKADFSSVQELISLNGYLNVPERNIALFDKLKTMDATYAEARSTFLMLIWEQLVALKRYDELNDEIDDLAKQIAMHISEALINNDFPTRSPTSSPMYQNYLRNSIVEEGGKVFETLLALNKTENANKLAKWMLTYASDGEMYAQLINRAIDANRTDVASDLNDRARKALNHPKDLQLVQEAARRLPSARQ